MFSYLDDKETILCYKWCLSLITSGAYSSTEIKHKRENVGKPLFLIDFFIFFLSFAQY